MTIGQATLMRLYTLAQQARLASATSQRLEVHLSPDESTALADVLEAALRIVVAVIGRPELDMSEPSADNWPIWPWKGEHSTGFPANRTCIATTT